MTVARKIRAGLREKLAMMMEQRRADAVRQYRVARGGDRTRAWQKLRDATSAALKAEVARDAR